MVDVSRGGEVKSIRAGHGDGTSCPFRYLDILTFLTLSEGILLRSVTGRVLVVWMVVGGEGDILWDSISHCRRPTS